MFVARLDGDGDHIWSARFGGGTTQVGISVAMDAAHNTIVAGYFEGTIRIGIAKLGSRGAADSNVFVARFAT